MHALRWTVICCSDMHCSGVCVQATTKRRVVPRPPPPPLVVQNPPPPTPLERQPSLDLTPHSPPVHQAIDHDVWLRQIAEDAGMTIQAPRELPGCHLERHLAAAQAFRSTMDRNVPRHRCAVCACMTAADDIMVCNLTASPTSRSAIPNMELLRADYPKSASAPRDAHTTFEVQRAGEATTHTYCLWVDAETIVSPDHANAGDMWVNTCKECHAALKGTSSRSPTLPPSSLVRVDPGINDLPPLTPLEAIIVAPLRTNKHIVVLRETYSHQPEDQRQKGMRGHVIAFPSVHPSTIASAFPLNPDDICEHVGVVLLSNVTSREEVERRVQEAKVRCETV